MPGLQYEMVRRPPRPPHCARVQRGLFLGSSPPGVGLHLISAAACDARVSTLCAAEPDADGGRYADADAHAAGAEQVRLTREWQEIKFKCRVGPMHATSAAAALRLAATSALRVADTHRDGGRPTLPTPAYAPGRGRSEATRCPTRSFSQYVDSPAAGSSPLMVTCKVARRSAPTTGNPSASFCIVQSSHSDAEEEASTGSRTRLCDTSIYLCIYISIHLRINACIHPSTRPSINTLIHQHTIHQHTHPSTHSSINTSIHQHINPTTHLSIVRRSTSSGGGGAARSSRPSGGVRCISPPATSTTGTSAGTCGTRA